MTFDDASRNVPPGLHPRLTVVLVSGAPGEADALAAELAPSSDAIDGAALATAARRRAAADRELRLRDHQDTLARLAAERDAAADARDAAAATAAQLVARRARVVAGARWCEEEGRTVAPMAAALHQAEEALVAAREQSARASARLEHLAEQRAAAKGVLDEARAELADLEAAHLAEPALRRELEQAVRSMHEAKAELAAATATRDEVESAATATAARLAALDADLAVLPSIDADAADLLRAALADVTTMLAGPPDHTAVELADAIDRAHAELTRIGADPADLPAPGALEQAQARLAAAERELAQAQAALQAGAATSGPPEWWHELGVLHAAVVDAEARLTGRGRSTRGRYEAALAAEHEMLDSLGFDTYVDALLSGGRRPHEPVASRGDVDAAEAAVADAVSALDAAREDDRRAAPVVALLAEREHLVRQAAAMLGVDVSTDVVPLLRQHRAVPAAAYHALLDALVAVGAPVDAVSPVDTARAALARYDATVDAELAADLAQSRRDLESELARLRTELAATVTEIDLLTRAEDAARRAVTRLEGELHSRVEGDADPTRRAASAVALRDRILTLETQLAQARDQAEAAAMAAMVDAEAATEERDRARQGLLALARHAARLAEEIAPERRPAFDALANVGALGGALRAEAALLADDIAGMEARVSSTGQTLESAVAAHNGHQTLPPPGEPTGDDAVIALADLLAHGDPGTTRVIVDPLVTDVPAVGERLLDTILRASADQPVVVLTTDHDTLAWAIELPASDGAVVPLRALVPADRSLTPADS